VIRGRRGKKDKFLKKCASIMRKGSNVSIIGKGGRRKVQRKKKFPEGGGGKKGYKRKVETFLFVLTTTYSMDKIKKGRGSLMKKGREKYIYEE